MPIQAPKIMFLGSFDPQTLFFIIETHKRGYLTRKHEFWAINGRGRSSGVTCTREQEYKKKDTTQKVTESSLPTQTPFPSSHINQILRVGSYLGCLSWFQVSLTSVEKCGSSGGRNFGHPIDLAHRLYNCLWLPHKPWFILLSNKCRWVLTIGCAKKIDPTYFVRTSSNLHQFDNFWLANSQSDKIMWRTLIVHLT